MNNGNPGSLEKLIGYDPKKFEVVAFDDAQGASLIRELKASGNEYLPGVFVRPAGDHYIVLIEKPERILLKLYTDLEYLKLVVDRELVERKVRYYYLHIDSSTRQVVSIHGFDAVRKVIADYGRAQGEIKVEGKALLELTTGQYLYRDEQAVGSCEIFPDLESFLFSRNSAGKLQGGGDCSEADSEKKIRRLEKIFGLTLFDKSLQPADLELLTLKLYDYVRSADLDALMPELCALYAKYLRDNHMGTVSYASEDGEGRLILERNGIRYDIERTIGKTIENITDYEYALDRYFILLPLDE